MFFLRRIIGLLFLVIFFLPLFTCTKIDCPLPAPVDTTRTVKDTTLTLILQPNAAEGKDATIFYIVSQSTSKGPTDTTNFGYDAEFPAMEWSFSGSYGTKKALLQFNLSTIPTTSTVLNASLSLFGCPTCGDPGHAVVGIGSNAGLVQAITSPWDENTVTWNTRPSVTTKNQVALPASTSAGEDYTNIDVTSLVQEMVSNPSSGYGFMISMQDTTEYRRLIFSSSDAADSTKHPKIVITYKYQY